MLKFFRMALYIQNVLFSMSARDSTTIEGGNYWIVCKKSSISLLNEAYLLLAIK